MTCDSLGSIRKNVIQTINPSVMFDIIYHRFPAEDCKKLGRDIIDLRFCLNIFLLLRGKKSKEP